MSCNKTKHDCSDFILGKKINPANNHLFFPWQLPYVALIFRSLMRYEKYKMFYHFLLNSRVNFILLYFLLSPIVGVGRKTVRN